MELAEFIKTTLIDIAKGVQQANDHIGGSQQGKSLYILPGPSSTAESGITFDVAVTVSGRETKGAGGGIQIAIAKVSAGGEEASSREHVSRIKFRVGHGRTDLTEFGSVD